MLNRWYQENTDKTIRKGDMEIVIPIIAAVVGVCAGAGGIFAYNKSKDLKKKYYQKVKIHLLLVCRIMDLQDIRL